MKSNLRQDADYLQPYCILQTRVLCTDIHYRDFIKIKKKKKSFAFEFEGTTILIA